MTPAPPQGWLSKSEAQALIASTATHLAANLTTRLAAAESRLTTLNALVTSLKRR